MSNSTEKGTILAFISWGLDKLASCDWGAILSASSQTVALLAGATAVIINIQKIYKKPSEDEKNT